MVLFLHMVRYTFIDFGTAFAGGLFSYKWFTFNMLQTGSGKTYTMGTGLKDSCQTGLIPQVMSALFNKIEALKHQTEYQLHVSFIEV